MVSLCSIRGKCTLLKHVANVRDLGGIVGAGGKHVVKGRLYRGGHLRDMDENDSKAFRDELGIRHIIDLRSPSELEEKPDIVPEGVDYVYLPSLTNEQNPSINRHNRNAELSRIMKVEGGAIGHLSSLYRTMITQEMAIKSHREVLLKLLENKGGFYWHCTQGKDRTGVTSAVVLMALGVSDEDIINDYLNEARSLKIRNWFLTTLVGVIKFNMKAKSSLSALMNAKRPCMEAALDEVKQVYGNADNYIRDGIGISEEQIKSLREIYLA